MRRLDYAAKSFRRTEPMLGELTLTPSEYIELANHVFDIREARLPMAIKKHRIGEHSLGRQQTVPMKAKLPHGGAPRALDEQALDLYVKHWNDRQRFVGELLQLEWTSHPSAINLIGFTVNERF